MTPPLALRSLPALRKASELHRDSSANSESRWNLATLSGRLVELSSDCAAARLTPAFSLLLQAQFQQETAAWITSRSASFYPVDAAEWGIDLEALAVIRLPDDKKKGGSRFAAAAEKLLRSGAFSLIILDLARCSRLPFATQGRLVRLAEEHNSALICLTEKKNDTPSLGSMVSLRGHSRRLKTQDTWHCIVEFTKDKRRAPHWTHKEVCHAPPGLC